MALREAADAADLTDLETFSADAEAMVKNSIFKRPCRCLSAERCDNVYAAASFSDRMTDPVCITTPGATVAFAQPVSGRVDINGHTSQRTSAAMHGFRRIPLAPPIPKPGDPLNQVIRPTKIRRSMVPNYGPAKHYPTPGKLRYVPHATLHKMKSIACSHPGPASV